MGERGDVELFFWGGGVVFIWEGGFSDIDNARDDGDSLDNGDKGNVY